MNNKYLVVVFWILIFAMSLFIFPKFFAFIEVNHKPSDNPPWYFILIDFKASLSALLGSILTCVLLRFSRIDKKNLRMLVFFTLIWYGNSIGNGISILMNTENLLDPTLASTSWETQSDYLGSTWKKYLFYVFLCIVGIIYYKIDKKKNIDHD